MKRLDEILKRCEAATDQDWYWDPKGCNWLMSPTKTVLSASHDNGYASCVSIKDHDAEFIAHARTDLPLVVEALQKAVGTLRFYAERSHWEKKCHCGEYYVVSTDEGANARSLLSEIEALLEER